MTNSMNQHAEKIIKGMKADLKHCAELDHQIDAELAKQKPDYDRVDALSEELAMRRGALPAENTEEDMRAMLAALPALMPKKRRISVTQWGTLAAVAVICGFAIKIVPDVIKERNAIPTRPEETTTTTTTTTTETTVSTDLTDEWYTDTTGTGTQTSVTSSKTTATSVTTATTVTTVTAGPEPTQTATTASDKHTDTQTGSSVTQSKTTSESTSSTSKTTSSTEKTTTSKSTSMTSSTTTSATTTTTSTTSTTTKTSGQTTTTTKNTTPASSYTSATSYSEWQNTTRDVCTSTTTEGTWATWPPYTTTSCTTMTWASSTTIETTATTSPYYEYADVEFQIVDDDGNPIEGVKLALYEYYDDTDPVETWITDENASVLSIPAGTYYLRVLSVPEGYQLPQGAIRVKAYDSRVVSVRIHRIP